LSLSLANSHGETALDTRRNLQAVLAPQALPNCH
jgi:hypothetical protein